jgi:hypothetical protein
MVAEGKSNLSIALALQMSIKDVIVAVQGMEDERGKREDIVRGFDYVPTGLPDRKSRGWTTGERKAVLESEAPLSKMAERLGRTYGSVKAQRSMLRKEQGRTIA